MREENPTVYSSKWGRHCPRCGKPDGKCICGKTTAVKTGDGIVRIQRDSKGRKGKTVTLISGFSLQEDALRDLLSDFKRLCGAGGAIKDGILEIQGDHRDFLFEEIKKRGFTIKKVGG